MTRSDARQNCVNGIETSQSENAAHTKGLGVRWRPSQTVILWLYQLESKFVTLRVCNLNLKHLKVGLDKLERCWKAGH